MFDEKFYSNTVINAEVSQSIRLLATWMLSCSQPSSSFATSSSTTTRWCVTSPGFGRK